MNVHISHTLTHQKKTDNACQLVNYKKTGKNSTWSHKNEKDAKILCTDQLKSFTNFLNYNSRGTLQSCYNAAQVCMYIHTCTLRMYVCMHCMYIRMYIYAYVCNMYSLCRHVCSTLHYKKICNQSASNEPVDDCIAVSTIATHTNTRNEKAED